MTSPFLKICIIGSLLIQISCNNNKEENKPGDAGTTTGREDSAAPDRPADNQANSTVDNKKEYTYDQAYTISGKIGTETFYGAPGYGENPETDKKENPYLLILDQPVNFIGDANPEDDSKESKYNVGKIQLIYNETDIDMARYMGSKVQLTGTFFGAHTGHHHTPVLMDVTGIKAP